MDSLHYSENAKLNRYLFFKHVNEVNIFVEDADKEYEYETIFKKIFENDLKVATIFAVGGKINVEIAYEAFGPTYDNAKNVYIVDGDFDRFLKNPPLKTFDNFIYLDSYNIENYYIDESAVITFMKGKLKKLDEDVKKIVNFDIWLDTIIKQFTPIFILYVIIQDEKLGIPNVGTNEHQKLDQKNGLVLENLYSDIEKEISKHINNLSELEENIHQKYNSYFGSNYFNLICGKHLIVSLYYHLKSIHSSVKLNDLKWALISDLNKDKFNNLKQTVLDFCK